MWLELLKLLLLLLLLVVLVELWECELLRLVVRTREVDRQWIRRRRSFRHRKGVRLQRRRLLAFQAEVRLLLVVLPRRIMVPILREGRVGRRAGVRGGLIRVALLRRVIRERGRPSRRPELLVALKPRVRSRVSPTALSGARARARA